MSIFTKREPALIFAICIVATVRLFIGSTAFPFFGVCDEHEHYDVIYKYSIGHIPGGMETYDPRAGALEAYLESPEVLDRPEDRVNGMIPLPLWQTPETAGVVVQQGSEWYSRFPSTETTQPPLYYALAAAWSKLGGMLHLEGAFLLYWLRFLNIPIYGLLVWLSYLFARRFYPSLPFMRLAMPLMLVFFPQDIFYFMNNDVLSPLVVGFAVYCLLILYLEDRSAWFHVATGLLVAAGMLTKFTNVAILPIFIAVLVLKPRLPVRKAHENKAWRLWLAFGAMALPLGAWLTRNALVIGDITGSGDKVDILGWTLKPLSKVFDHPIFTPGGFWTFLYGFVQTFWRGEMVWYGKVMALQPVDLFYAGTSLVFLVAAAAATLHRTKKAMEPERLANLVGLGMLAVSIAFLYVISIAYDFGNCYNPSRDHPYLNQGRLVLGMLIPFLGLYLYGMQAVLARIKLEKLRTPLIILMLLVMLSSEAYVTAPVFKSQYNWYAMRDSYLDLDVFVTVQSSER